MNQSEDEMRTIKLIETPYDLEGRDIICYPALILYAKIKVFRLLLKPRIVYAAITVDMVRGEAARSDIFPEFKEIEINSNSLIKKMATTGESVEEAKKLILKWTRHKFKVYKVPDIEIISQEEVYKAFFYAQFKGEKVLVDSVKGVDMN